MKYSKLIIPAVAIALSASSAFAGSKWSLNGTASTLGFVTTKNGDVSEAHYFSGLSGSVSEDGKASISIPLSSVETFIDIRNERMREFLFKVGEYPAATVSASIDMTAFNKLKAGKRSTQEIELTLKANGSEVSYPADVNVTRISDTTVSVTSARPVLTHAADLGYTEGVAKLQELAGLDSISPSVPVTFDLMFTK